MKTKTFIYCDSSELNLQNSKKRIDAIRKTVKNLPENCFGIRINDEKWPFQTNSVDCIINNLNLHNSNNLEGLFRSYNSCLVSDGLFAANAFGPDTFLTHCTYPVQKH